MKKKLLPILVFMLPLMAIADIVKIDGIYFNLDPVSNSAEITHNPNWNYHYTGRIVLPERISYKSVSYDVIGIGDNAFNNCSGLTSIIIPEGITTIGDGAFWGCSGLTTITLPESLTYIVHAAFFECSGLTSIIIPKNVANIGDNAFNGCSGLSSIIVAEGNEKYDSRENCNAIINSETNTLCRGCKNSFIPDGVISIGNGAFSLCSDLTSIIIPKSVTNIGSDAFYGCSDLMSINIPEGVTSIGNSAFYGCSEITSIFIPESVTNIGASVFGECTSLISVSLPKSLTCIESYTFANCIGLSSIIIPDSVSNIKEYAFYKCTGLSSIIIPESVTNIENAAFYGCKLHYIIAKNSQPPALKQGVFSEEVLYHAILYVPSDRWDAYAFNEWWYRFHNIREITLTLEQISEEQVYTIIDTKTFEYSVYDPVNDCIGSIGTMAGINEDNPNHSWQIIEAGGSQYLYNLGAKKFAYKGIKGLELADMPTPIVMEDGENGIILGGQTSQQWALVSNEYMNRNYAIITSITPLLPKQDTNNRYYDFSGRRLHQPVKGLNIVNGKKVMKK